MLKVSKEDMLKAFKAIGLKKGDIILVFSNLARLGAVDNAVTKEEALDTYRSALMETIDSSLGTLVVPTFTYSFAHEIPFDYESSPSELCMFGEFIRKQKDAFRSFHPHFSFAAIGKAKYEVCDKISRSAFGYESVFDRLYKRNAKIMFLGTNITEGLTFFLYIEHMVGVSHCYHKAYFTPVYKNKKLIKGPFFSYVRQLEEGFQADLSSFERDLKEAGLVKEAKLGAGKIQLVTCSEVFDVGYKKLQEKPCYFYSRELYITK